MNCGFLYSSVSSQPLTGFAEGFCEFPYDAGVAHRTTVPLNSLSKHRGSSCFQRNKPQIPGKQQQIITAQVYASWADSDGDSGGSVQGQPPQSEGQPRQGVCGCTGTASSEKHR